MSASWEISDLPGWLEIREITTSNPDEGGRLVAEVFDINDARLIKTAPKLLAALKNCAFSMMAERVNPKDPVWAQLKEAIAEAEPSLHQK